MASTGNFFSDFLRDLEYGCEEEFYR